MHPLESFTMHPVDEYKLFLAHLSIFIHSLGSFNPYVPAQFEFYFDY